MNSWATCVVLLLLSSGCASAPPPVAVHEAAPSIGPPHESESALEKSVPLPLVLRPICPGEDKSSYCEKVREGEQMMRGPRHASAARDLAQALTAEKPERSEGWLLLGRAEGLSEPYGFGEGGEGTKRALVAFEQARTRAPEDPVVQLEVARSLLALGQAEPAEPLLIDLAQRFPDDPEVLGGAGVCLLGLGRVSEARVHFERAAKLDDRVAERWVALGAVRMLEGDLDLAEAAFRQALHLDPELAKGHGDLGALLLLRGRTDEGLRHIERALGLEPKNAAYLSNLAYGHYLSGHSEAIEWARKAVRADESFVSARLTLALILAAAGQLDEASEQLSTAEALDPNDPRVSAARADLETLRRTPPDQRQKSGGRGK